MSERVSECMGVKALVCWGEGVLLDGLKVVEWMSGGSGVGYAVCMVWFE